MPDNSVTSLGTTVKYNPHLWGKDELRAIFVLRTRELDEVIARIRATETNKVPQHLLITGTRGMGKSTLLNRIALAIADDAELSTQWLALLMPEEQYTVASLTELWLNVLGVLADTLEHEGVSFQALNQLSSDVANIKTLPANEQEAAALNLLTHWIKQRGRRLVLCIDSTDQLLASLNQDATKAAKHSTGSTQLWRLRKTLSHCPDLFWIGASYQSLESTQQYSDAFHDFFEVLELRALTLDEMRQTMLALAQTFGIANAQGQAVAEQMARNMDARPERLKTLRMMTGGNPRTTTILYELFAASGQEDLQNDLKALLDLMTPLYKARMEQLAEQPRKILAHIMEYWAPIALGELAQISNIPNTTLSGQLKRLELDGFIEKVKLPGTSRSGYQTSERLFNIWYLMRYTSRWIRQKLTWLVEFMRLWYSTEELRSLASTRSQAHSYGGLRDGEHLELSIAYAAALPDNCRERYPEAEEAYCQAEQLDPFHPYPVLNRARLAAQRGQFDLANELYRSAAKLAADQASENNDIDFQASLLQAHLFLNNRDAARLALENLAQAASTGDDWAWSKLREQAYELQAIKLGLAFSELIAESRYADFLLPLSLALRAANQVPEALDGVAAEIKNMAEQVLAEITANNKGN